jgi:hypothetical protein
MDIYEILKDSENKFIERCKKEFPALTAESEMSMRYAFAQGAQEFAAREYVSVYNAKQSEIRGALNYRIHDEEIS